MIEYASMQAVLCKSPVKLVHVENQSYWTVNKFFDEGVVQ